MKKIKLTESDLYRIIKQVLLEQEEEKRTVTFSPGTFKNFITSSSGEGFVRTLNNKFDEIIVNGDLDLSETSIESLPDNLYVGEDLNLIRTPIQSLPNNLYVGGELNLLGCKNLQSLGDNLYVGGSLDLRGTQIQSLPDNLDVKGTIYIAITPLNKNHKLVKKYNKKYAIYRT